MDTAYVSDS